VLKIIKSGLRAQGQKEALMHYQGKKLTPVGAIKAHCYMCMGMFVDGKIDCGDKDCTLYQYYPYRGKK